ncbi:ATP synthase subunit I [Alicycliphilus denitrificans]|uniref:ATP synthase subunit I n=1 Tax=Alicycliphilus denitrificans TaxID=179636 RepID=UPI00384FBBBB
MAQESTREKSTASEAESEAEDSDFKPLTARQAQEWRKRQVPLSVWRIVAIQAVMGVLVALLAWWLTGRPQVAWSAGYGALSVVLPAALFARGVSRSRSSAGAAMVGLFGWELVKIALTVAMLVAAPRLVPGLSWLALLAGMVVVMKTYWIALLARPGVRRTD